MPIDDDTWDEPATKGDVAGLAINMAIALRNVIESLEALQARKEIPADILASLADQRRDIRQIFDRLSGWTNDDVK